MLVAGLVLLSHVTGLVPHAVTVLHPDWREAAREVVAVFAGATALKMEFNLILILTLLCNDKPD